jgi:hypothetical protein
MRPGGPGRFPTFGGTSRSATSSRPGAIGESEMSITRSDSNAVVLRQSRPAGSRRKEIARFISSVFEYVQARRRTTDGAARLTGLPDYLLADVGLRREDLASADRPWFPVVPAGSVIYGSDLGWQRSRRRPGGG